tara:strand:+ start:11696 stop:11824 length:129 start_codon:yes stop_codon:yes gene_type:complete
MIRGPDLVQEDLRDPLECKDAVALDVEGGASFPPDEERVDFA